MAWQRLGAMNSLYLKQGMEQRWGKMKALLRILGHEVAEDAYIDGQFNYNIPMNSKKLLKIW